jgi:small subunit ribosomal protein S27Ae
MIKRELFKVEGDRIVRLRKNCPKCGDGVFLAEHKDRLSCGQCGYTEFKGRTQQEPEPKSKVEEASEQPAEGESTKESIDTPSTAPEQPSES